MYILSDVKLICLTKQHTMYGYGSGVCVLRVSLWPVSSAVCGPARVGTCPNCSPPRHQIVLAPFSSFLHNYTFTLLGYSRVEKENC